MKVKAAPLWEAADSGLTAEDGGPAGPCRRLRNWRSTWTSKPAKGRKRAEIHEIRDRHGRDREAESRASEKVTRCAVSSPLWTSL